MTPEELSRSLRGRFEEAGLDNPAQESVWLTAHVLGIPPGEVNVRGGSVPPDSAAKAESLARRRLAGEPLQYILGDEYFGEERFLVGPGVLIPRPETLFLADFATAVLPSGGAFCEIGTGSGAVALTVAKRRPDVSVHASELSPAALEWAEKNRKNLDLPGVDLRLGAFFEPFPPEMKFDCVAANLPYIPYSEKENLQREVRCFEPPEALFADHGGKALVEQALELLSARLLPGGKAAFEAGSEQLEDLRESARKLFPKTAVANDLFGRPRFLIIG